MILQDMINPLLIHKQNILTMMWQVNLILIGTPFMQVDSTYLIESYSLSSKIVQMYANLE